MRIELNLLQQWIAPQSRVLDLGCGDGTLLRSLIDNRHVEGYGMEIDPDQINACVAKGVSVIEDNIDEGLNRFPDASFDTVVMTQALQVLRCPDKVLKEMLRIGRECIVTFPNFGNWRARSYLVFRGRMPVTKQLTYQWFDTPNIHFCTVRDFEALCRDLDIRILHRSFVSEHPIDKQLGSLWPNLFSETAIYHLGRGG